MTEETTIDVGRWGDDEQGEQTAETWIGYLDDAGEYHHVARLASVHHEAAGWADAASRYGRAVVIRPADYDGCPCNRCKQGWTQSGGRDDDRELPGDRLEAGGRCLAAVGIAQCYGTADESGYCEAHRG